MSSIPSPVAIIPYRAILAEDTSGSGASQSATSIQVTTSRHFTTLIADAVVSERHDDELVITDNPVEQGSVISDHAYAMPAILELVYCWSLGSKQNTTQDYSFLQKLYQQFLAIHKGRQLCKVNTGKRIYTNMLMQRVSTESDRDNENSLTIRITMREVILAQIQIVPVSSADSQALPRKTSPIINQGNVNLNVGTSLYNGSGTLP